MKDKAAKAAYDKARRERLKEEIRAKKKSAYAVWGPANRDRERENKKKRMSSHIEYCRQPEYKNKKVRYDVKRRASVYGEFSECYELLLQLLKEIRRQEPDRMKRYQQSGRHNWSPLTYEKRRLKHDQERQRKQGRNDHSGVDRNQSENRIVEYPQRLAGEKGSSR